MMQIRMKLLMIVMLLSCGISMFAKEIISEKTAADHSITVFVHGTIPMRKILHHSLSRFLIYCPQGLSLAKDLPNSYYFHKMAQSFIDLNSELYNFDQFYLFGWESEHVYDHVRARAAAGLIDQLQNRVNIYYQMHGVVPKIRLLGFSHGGNVLLHTANYLPLIVNEQPAEVEIWLFGTPVQHANKSLVNSKKFNKVYSFYSQADWIQRMDPQGLRDSAVSIKNLWSDRMFDLTDRCIQIEFTVNGQGISHAYYRSIFKYFPVIQKITQEKSQGMLSGCIAVDLKK